LIFFVGFAGFEKVEIWRRFCQSGVIFSKASPNFRAG